MQLLKRTNRQQHAWHDAQLYCGYARAAANLQHPKNSSNIQTPALTLQPPTKKLI
jgi:hypothetical protein